MKLPKVTIQIVTFNGMKYLPDCLASIYNQTYKDFQVLIIDNDSQDETVKFIKNNYPEIAVFKNNKNIGFARANNQGIKLLHSPFLVVCNQDIILEPTWLEKIMIKAEDKRYEKYGSFGGKLLRVKYDNDDEENVIKTNIIDSCGLKINKNRRTVDLFAGRKSDDFNNDQEVFGQSGALVLFRRRALDSIIIKNDSIKEAEYFDNDFFMYKEDVDLFWRMVLFGWHSLTIADAIAYHYRSVSGSEAHNWRNIIKNRKRQNKRAGYYSYRNHFFTLIKNELPRSFWLNFFAIFKFELKKIVYISFFETRNLYALIDVFKMFPKMRNKRKIIFNKVKKDNQEIKKWIK